MSRPAPLADILCAQLAESMQWVKRYQRDKHTAIAGRMLTIMTDFMGEDRLRLLLANMVAGTTEEVVREEILDLLYLKGNTLETLRGANMRSS
jgi:hypothetical protein